MKQISFFIAALLCSGLVTGQISKGKIIYERTVQMQIHINDDNPAFSNMVPRERKDRFELLFANNRTLWRVVEDEDPDDEMAWNDGGARIRIVMPASDDVFYTNLDDMKKTDQRELAGKNYIVSDSVTRLNWKLSDETKEILGHVCRKAATWRTQESFRINNENGNITREKITDTLNIEAWFASDIPLFAGPENYQGQLPGTILEVNVNDGRSSFKAVEISPKVDVNEIKEPKSGKKLTAAEFAKEREKFFAEMQQNGGGNLNMRIRN